MKNDVNDPEFIKKRTQNIKYMLLKELGYEGDDLKIDIMPFIVKGNVLEIEFQFYLSVFCEGDLDDIVRIPRQLNYKVDDFFDKFGFNNEYNFVGNPNPRDYSLMGPMIYSLNFSADNDELKINVAYMYDTIDKSINPQTSE
jgi:hypothetical protein